MEQSRLLGEWYAQRQQGFSRVITGGMNRHRQSAVACLGALPRALRKEGDWETDAGFAEYNHDKILARHRPEFSNVVELQRFLADSENPRKAFQHNFEAAMARWMGGANDGEYTESWPVFRARCIAALQRVVMSPATSQSIIVFTSGGTISTIVQHVLGLRDQKMFELNWTLANAGVTRLLYQADRLSLSYLNNFAHLEWPGKLGSITSR